MVKPNPYAIFDSPDAACRQVASEIAHLIRERSANSSGTVLGLATGNTPLPLYRELIRLHQEQGLSFQSVTSFNLDDTTVDRLIEVGGRLLRESQDFQDFLARQK